MTLSHFVSNSVHINIRCKNKDIFRTNKPKDNKIIFFSQRKMISKIQLIGNKEVTLFVKLNR